MGNLLIIYMKKQFVPFCLGIIFFGAVSAQSVPPPSVIMGKKEVPILCYHQIRDWKATDSKVSKDYIMPPADLKEADDDARDQADASRVKPGTPEFEALKNTVIQINNWDIQSGSIPDAPPTGGAALMQRSHLYHLEGQWDLSEKIKIFNLLIGGDARLYEIIPDGNNFVDFSRPIDERNKRSRSTGLLLPSHRETP